MANILIKDANGKELSVDLAKIKDINGDVEGGFSASTTDSTKNRLSCVHNVEFVDSKGNAIDSAKLLKDMANGTSKIYALDVEMEATHSGRNHNYVMYYEDSMEKDCESFMNPFRKPILKNHNDYSGEPMGRIKSSTFGPSQLTDERSAIHLTARVTDQDAIPKFLDGRYATVSIGGSMGTVTCNICGKTILKDGKFNFCGHWRGETYKDQVCYWGAKDIEYHEVSTVNNPADDFAQITKITVITDEDSNEDSNKRGDNKMGDQAQKTNVNTQDFKTNLLAAIDELLGDSTATTTDSNTEGADGTGAAVAEDGAKDPATQTSDANSTEKTVEDMQKELDTANTKITDLTQQLADANAALEKAKTEKEEAVNDSIAMKDQCITLALANKKYVADSVIELEIQKGQLEDAKKEDRSKELLGKSMKDLNAMLEDLKTKDSTKQRETATVTNPALANAGEANTVVTDANGNPVGQSEAKDADSNKETTTSDKRETVDDFANDIVKKLFK